MCKCTYDLWSSFCSNRPKWWFSVRLSREPLTRAEDPGAEQQQDTSWVAHQICLCSAAKTETQLLAPSLKKLPHLREREKFLWELYVGPDKLCEGPGSFSCSNWKCLLLLSFGVSEESDLCLILLSSSGLLPCLGLQMEVFWKDLAAVEEPPSGNSPWCPDMFSIPLREAGMKY